MPVSTSQIQNAYVAFFNRPADTAGLNYWSSYAGSSADLLTTFAQSSEYTSLFTGLNNTQAVNLIYNNLFGRDADLSGLNYWVGQLTNGSVKIANIADAVNKGAQGTDSTIITSKTTAATAFTTSLDTVAKVVAYSSVSTSGLAAVKTWLSAVKDATTLATATSSSGLAAITTTVSSSATSTVAGSTFTLTTGTNSFTGTSGADTFDGGISSSSLQTLNSGDSLDGGAGTDDLYAVITGSVTPSALKNIENVYVTNTTANATIDFSNATGLSAVSNSASTFALTMAGLKSVSGPTVTVRDTAIAGQIVSFNDVTGSADSATVIINNTQSGASLTVAGVETLTLQSDGSATNVLGTTLLAGLVAGAATKLNVTGSQGLTMAMATTAVVSANVLPSTIVNLNASGNTNTTTGVTATMSSTNASTIVGSAGNDSIATWSLGADSISMGAGNDTIWYANNSTWTVADTIDGGAGTDTLRVLAANIAGIATPTTYNTTNIETIQITNALAAATYTPVNISAAATTLNVTGNTDANGILTIVAATLSVTNSIIAGPAGSFAVGLGASVATNTLGLLTAGGNLTINDTGTAITDSLTISNNAMVTSGAALNVYNGQNLVVNGYETVTIGTSTTSGVANTFATITVTGDAGGTSIETVKFTGANILTMTGVISADIIDASGLTAAGTAAAPTITMITGSTATSITGSAGMDLLLGNTTTASSISGGAGNDTLTGGSANDTILGGADNDSITAGSGNDSILGGDGNDTINMAANLASGDVIDGGAGTDTLLASAAITASAAATVSNVEIISFSATAAQDMTGFLNAGITTLGATAGTLTVTNAQTTLTSLIAGVSGAGAWTGASVTRLVDGTADSLSLLIVDGSTAPTVGTASFANEETLTIGESGTDSTAAITVALGTVTATSLTTLNITGSNVHTMALTGETALATVSALAATGALTITGGNSAANMTVTGPASASLTITTGSGNDSITGGAAGDILTGGTGNDTVLGGAGGDTIVNGPGVDSLVGGDGSDTLSMTGWTIGTTLDGGTTAVTGTVVNLSSSAITAATIASHVANIVVVNQLNTDISSVASNTSGLLGVVATVSSRVDTLSGFEVVTGSTGKDYIVGSSSANTITGGTGADVMIGGSGADTFIIAVGDSIARTAENVTEAGMIAGETFVFANGVDVITDFTSGTDFLDVTTAANYTLLSAAGAVNATTVGNNYSIRGNYVATTGVFTQAAAGADSLVITSAVTTIITGGTELGIVILVGTTTLTAADFI